MRWVWLKIRKLDGFQCVCNTDWFEGVLSAGTSWIFLWGEVRYMLGNLHCRKAITTWCISEFQHASRKSLLLLAPVISVLSFRKRDTSSCLPPMTAWAFVWKVIFFSCSLLSVSLIASWTCSLLPSPRLEVLKCLHAVMHPVFKTCSGSGNFHEQQVLLPYVLGVAQALFIRKVTSAVLISFRSEMLQWMRAGVCSLGNLWTSQMIVGCLIAHLLIFLLYFEACTAGRNCFGSFF